MKISQNALFVLRFICPAPRLCSQVYHSSAPWDGVADECQRGYDEYSSRIDFSNYKRRVIQYIAIGGREFRNVISRDGHVMI